MKSKYGTIPLKMDFHKLELTVPLCPSKNTLMFGPPIKQCPGPVDGHKNPITYILSNDLFVLKSSFVFHWIKETEPWNLGYNIRKRYHCDMGNEIIYIYEYTFYFTNTIQLSLTIEYVARKIAVTENHCLLIWEYLKLTLQSGFKTCFVKLFVYLTTWFCY